MLVGYLDRYRTELLDSVVPFWLRHSIDTDFGGYFTCLDREGQPYDRRKYVWLQGRSVWMFSRLYNTLEPRPEWLAGARSGAEFLQRYASDSGGRYFFSLTREGQPAFFQRKPYSAAFVALGFLEYARATGEKSYKEEAVKLFWRIRSWIEFPGMLGRPVLDGAPPASQLADVMILAMLGTEFFEALADRRYLQAVNEALGAAMRHLEPKRMILLEQVAPNGAKVFDRPERRLFSPGHSIEVAWILLRHLQRFPDPQRQKALLESLEGALEFGWDKEHGGLHYFMDVEGRPSLRLDSEMKLWWPHTEAIYAVLLAYSITSDRRWLAWLERLDDYAFRHFADPEHGEWFGYRDRRGNLTSTAKGSDYKGMYHVPRFLLFSIQAIESMNRERAAAG